MYVCMHACMYVCNVCMPAYLPTYLPAYEHTRILEYKHTSMQNKTNLPAYTHTSINAHAKHACMPACKHHYLLSCFN